MPGGSLRSCPLVTIQKKSLRNPYLYYSRAAEKICYLKFVNTKQISKLVTQVSGEYLLVLDNGQELKVSRSYRDKVKAALAS